MWLSFDEVGQEYGEQQYTNFYHIWNPPSVRSDCCASGAGKTCIFFEHSRKEKEQHIMQCHLFWKYLPLKLQMNFICIANEI